MEKNKTMETITNEEKAREICENCMLKNKPFPKQLLEKELTHCDVCPSASIALKAMRWKDEQNTEFLVELKNAFESLTQMCDKLTSGNVAHQRPHLKGFARGWAEIIDEHLEKKGE